MPEPAHSTPWPRSSVMRWALALAVVGAALGLRGLMAPWLGDELPFVTIFGAVAAAAWWLGTGPAIGVGVVGFVASTMLFRGPEWLHLPWAAAQWLTLGGFALSAGVIVWFGHALHRARASAESETERCRAAEAKVAAEQRSHLEERKRNEEALAEADRRKDEFIATLAHELRNPLAPLRNGVHLLRILSTRDGDASSQAATFDKPLAIMERQIGHMVRLIDDLLDVGRVSGGKLALQRHRIDIADAVREAVETSQSSIQEAGHRLTVVLPTHPIHVDADLTRLCQVIANLLNNAAKFTPRGGNIRLSVEPREAGWVEVCVEDDGRGLAPQTLSEIFRMFTQVDRQAGGSGGGLGIGLAIARRLVQMHGGELSAASRGLGQGSSFTVRLPRAAVGLPAAPTAGLDRQADQFKRAGAATGMSSAARDVAAEGRAGSTSSEKP